MGHNGRLVSMGVGHGVSGVGHRVSHARRSPGLAGRDSPLPVGARQKCANISTGGCAKIRPMKTKAKEQEQLRCDTQLLLSSSRVIVSSFFVTSLCALLGILRSTHWSAYWLREYISITLLKCNFYYMPRIWQHTGWSPIHYHAANQPIKSLVLKILPIY